MIFDAFLFDMDGVIFNSMPHHALAWEEVMAKYNLDFTARDCYLQEGRTGQSVIDECFMKSYGRHALDSEWQPIYNEKTSRFHEMGKPELIPNITDVLSFLQQEPSHPLIYLVTGSGQQSLFDELQAALPGVFVRERMVTAFDYTHGKPDPEPYQKAYEKACCAIGPKARCCVVENAPLGIISAKAAGLFAVGVNTGVLREEDLLEAGADKVFPDMKSLLEWMKTL